MTTIAERLVVDASVVVKWHLTDEEDAHQAAVVLDRYAAGELALVAPEQIRYEVPNAITVATFGHSPRLTPRQAAAAIAEFLGLRMPTVSDDDLIISVHQVARQFRLAFYNALYMALAQRLRLPFLTADRRLYDRVRQLPGVTWLAAWAPRDPD